MKATKIWGIHSQDDRLFLENAIIAIGWDEMGNLAELETNKESFKAKYSSIYPHSKKMSIASCVGVLTRFVLDMQIGDYVVFPSKSNREINIGQIVGDYYYEESGTRYKQRRKVKWLKHFPRAAFTQGALYEIGCFLTCFLIKNYADEFLNALDKNFKVSEAEESIDETVIHTSEDIRDNTRDFILRELNRQLKGYDLEDFVAALLNAMGYRTKVSPHGGDHGIDIIAYKDELPPRILVQVKSTRDDITEAMVSSLGGMMENGDYGLFVTLSNFKKNAITYLEKHPSIKAINGEELVNLILIYYDFLSDKYRSIIPLEKVYIPVVKES